MFLAVAAGAAGSAGETLWLSHHDERSYNVAEPCMCFACCERLLSHIMKLVETLATLVPPPHSCQMVM